MAMVIHHADTSDGDNADIESLNAQARRRVKAALMQKKLDLQDLNAYLTFRQSKAECNTLWGEPLIIEEEATAAGPDAQADEAAIPKMKGGGGGLQLKYISAFKNQFIDSETGRLDIALANRSCSEQRAKPESEVLKSLAADARRGTLATREAFKLYGRSRASPMSCFGTVRKQHADRLALREKTQLVLQDMEAAVRAAPVSSSLDVVAVAKQQDALVEVVRCHVDGGSSEVAMLPASYGEARGGRNGSQKAAGTSENLRARQAVCWRATPSRRAEGNSRRHSTSGMG